MIVIYTCRGSFDTHKCGFYKIKCDFDTHECDSDICIHAEFNYDTYYCGFYTYKCDLFTKSVILTHTSVVYTRIRVILTCTRMTSILIVWFWHTRKVNFDTHWYSFYQGPSIKKKMKIFFLFILVRTAKKIHTISKQTGINIYIFSMLLFCFYMQTETTKKSSFYKRY
jgi:hypothetical protein